MKINQKIKLFVLILLLIKQFFGFPENLFADMILFIDFLALHFYLTKKFNYKINILKLLKWN